MKKHQPEFIQTSQIQDIIKSCIPYFEETTGRLWLDILNGSSPQVWEYQFKPFDQEGPLKNMAKLKTLIAEGLNEIEDNGNLNGVIQSRENEITEHDNLAAYYHELSTLVIPSDVPNNIRKELAQELDKLSSRLCNFSNTTGYELGLFTAWQKALEEKQHKQTKKELCSKPIDNGAILVPMAIADLASAKLIQETGPGSHVYINQKRSLNNLKRIALGKGLDWPSNEFVRTFIFRMKNGSIIPYSESTIRGLDN